MSQHDFGDRYPSHEDYATLYAKYLQGDRTKEMLSAVDIRGKKVMDLCGGGGRLSREAVAMGACQVLYVDQSIPMGKSIDDPRILKLFVPVQQVLESRATERDQHEKIAVFCQQAINYWLTQDTAATLAKALASGSTFVFNTFNAKPVPFPVPKTYVLNHKQYMELSWLTEEEDGTQWVEHIQIMGGSPCHRTRFRWISPEQFEQWLSPGFDLDIRQDGATSLYVCTRK
jgi:16S rRNA G966 N2-methylase RsmD